MNNECVNIYVTWYRLYNILHGGRDVDIIDLNYKKEHHVCLITKLNPVIILKARYWYDLQLSLQKLCLG